jgi:hypothetical protein
VYEIGRFDFSGGVECGDRFKRICKYNVEFYASEGFYNRRRWRFKKRSICKLIPLLVDVENNKCECFYSIFEKTIPLLYIGCSFKFPVKVGIEESIVNVKKQMTGTFKLLIRGL